MKKLLCLLLTVLLICAQMTALAESGYVSAKGTIASAFGEGTSTLASEYENENFSKFVIITFDLYRDEPSTLLIGYNENGEYESTVWSLSFDYEVALVYALCATWDEMEAALDEGFSLTYAIIYSESSDDIIFISDAETAEAMASLLDFDASPDEE